MNIALENTEEYVDGKLKNKYGDTFVRGNNGKQIQQYARHPLTRIVLLFYIIVLYISADKSWWYGPDWRYYNKEQQYLLHLLLSKHCY
jgi:ABC-type cobalamin transport system permease subunit